MTGIEDRLRDALVARAETVQDDGRPRALPVSRPCSPAGRWWVPSAMAAAIVLVVALTFVATRTVAPPPPATRPTPSVGPFAPPVEQVWPDAVHEIPTTAPGSRAFHPDVFVSDRVVVGRGITETRPNSVWSYDVDKRTFTEIAPLGNVRAIEPVVFGSGYLAWPAFRGQKMEIWVVPVTGGVPRRLASVTGLITSKGRVIGADNLAIADDAVVWSPMIGGVYRLPLKGGKPALMAGTRGLHLVEWPWAGLPRDDGLVGPPLPRPMERLKNVLTGEIRDATAPAGRWSWDECGVTWCLKGMEAWRRDGSGFRVLPGYGHSRSDLYAGRYVVIRQRDHAGQSASAVHDLGTGRTGLLLHHTLARRGLKAPSTLRVRGGMVWYQTGRGTQVLLRLMQ
ncbi:hypothetical protein [Nonomuraea sp. KM90]|uniref:hypothetical protein n=1 Tax=Nonomuraea sp. KM90 TaxID=3457428 RepID=UPI003FCCE034